MYHFSIVEIIYRFLFPIFFSLSLSLAFPFCSRIFFLLLFSFYLWHAILHTFLFVVNNYILMLTISFSHFSFRFFCFVFYIPVLFYYDYKGSPFYTFSSSTWYYYCCRYCVQWSWIRYVPGSKAIFFCFFFLFIFALGLISLCIKMHDDKSFLRIFFLFPFLLLFSLFLLCLWPELLKFYGWVPYNK